MTIMHFPISTLPPDPPVGGSMFPNKMPAAPGAADAAAGRAPPPLRQALAVWGLAAALYLIGFFQRVTPAVMTHELMKEFSIRAAALGNLSALYLHGYVAIQIPTGLLVDRWGPRRVLTAGAAFVCVVCVVALTRETYCRPFKAIGSG